MAANKPGKAEILAAFFDDGTYSPLFTDGAVSAAYGCANGQNAYVVFEDGSPVGVQDIEKNIRVLEMAAETGAPVVTFYDSTGAKLEGGLDLLNANARLTAEDKVANAGSAAFAAKAGVAAVTTADAVAAAKQAASIVALLPANNLAGPALFDFAAPSKALDLVKYSAADAIAALADEGSTVELYAGYGKNIVTALATINGSAVGILATEKAALCHKCTAKAARFVRLCDAYSIPVVTVVNTEGFGKSEGDDQAGGIRQAARMAGVYAEATTVKVAVLAGEAVGPAYTVFAACADWRVAVQGCTVAPLAPEAAVTVLYKDEIFASDNIVNATKAKAAAYAKEVCSANAAVANGAADAIADAATARGAVAQALDMLASKRTVRLAKKHGNITL